MKGAVAVATLVLAACVVSVHAIAPGTNWAVLVAGSNTWSNYRHQADVCHSYQVLHKHGIPDSNIIVMMYDDIAKNPENPTKGVVINQPDGPNVYTGVPKDYTGSQVTPQNFLKVLRGDKAGLKGVGSGRVLESGPNDNVFIFFSDHGGPRIIAFPNDVLQATDLISALTYMHTNKKYNQLVFYLEACESGSMFSGLLPSNINIYATTASDPDSSSYACYYDNKLQTYLGDVYSVNWLQDSDKANFTVETLAKQYQIVKQETNTSTVEQYGQTSISSETLAYFQQGPAAAAQARRAEKQSSKPVRHPSLDAVSSRDVPMAILQQRLKSAQTLGARSMVRQQIAALQRQHNQIDRIYSEIIAKVDQGSTLEQHMRKVKTTPDMYDCIDRSNLAFHRRCVNLGKFEYALKGLTSFVSLCQTQKADTMVEAIAAVCGEDRGEFIGGVY